MNTETWRVAVVGGGVAGLTCARSLEGENVNVTVFEKGRAVGGRLSARRVGPSRLDLGAQYFTVRDPQFERIVQTWAARGACEEWQGRILALPSGGSLQPTEPLPRWVGIPDMSEPGRQLAAKLRVHTGHRVDRCVYDGKRHALFGTVAPRGVTLGPASGAELSTLTHFGDFDAVVFCLPPPQAVPLLEPVSPLLADEAGAIPFVPCFATGFLVGPNEARALADLPFDGVFVGRDDGTDAAHALSWVARTSSKPGRHTDESWVLHATGAWSQASFETPEAETGRALLDTFASTFGLPRLQPETIVTRRWALSRTLTPLARSCLFDDRTNVGVGGDWACGGRMEGAFVSGLRLARHVLQRRDGMHASPPQHPDT